MSTPLSAARLRLRIAATLLVVMVLIGWSVGGGGFDMAAAAQRGPILTTTSTPTTGDTTPTTGGTTPTSSTSTSTSAVVTPTTDVVTSTTFRSTTTRATVRTTTTRAATVTSTTQSEVIETTTTTGRNLLVAGDGTDGAESTTTSTTTPPSTVDEGGLSESALIWIIVAGLVGIAVLIGWWTVRYWKATDPQASDDGVEAVASGSRSPSASGGGDDPTTVF